MEKCKFIIMIILITAVIFMGCTQPIEKPTNLTNQGAGGLEPTPNVTHGPPAANITNATNITHVSAGRNETVTNVSNANNITIEKNETFETEKEGPVPINTTEVELKFIQRDQNLSDSECVDLENPKTYGGKVVHDNTWNYLIQKSVKLCPKTYSMSSNSPSPSLITIAADNITLDCNGATLTVTYPPELDSAGRLAILNPGYDGTIIKNCISQEDIIFWPYEKRTWGSDVGTSENCAIFNCTLVNATMVETGGSRGGSIWIYDVKNSAIFNNTVYRIEVGGSNESVCDNLMSDNFNYEGRPILYYNEFVSLSNMDDIYQLILCNADGSTVDNVHVRGIKGKENLVQPRYNYSSHVGEGGGISLVYTDNTLIENSRVSDSEFGVAIYRGNNNVISNNEFLNNRRGVQMEFFDDNLSIYNTFTHNTLIGNWDGFSIMNTPRIIITNNFISENGGDGIQFSYSKGGGSIISNNTLTKNLKGISLGEVENVTVSGNIIINNEQGIFSSDSTDLNVYENDIQETKYSIVVAGTNLSEFRHNTCSNSPGYCLMIWDSYNNTFTRNVFFNNTMNFNNNMDYGAFVRDNIVLDNNW